MQEEGRVSNGIIDCIKEVAQQEVRKLRLPEIGIVTSSFPHESDSDKDNYECNVRLKNTELELRRVQVATGNIGFVSAPKVGDMVLVAFVNGDINMPVIVGRLYNDQDRPPANKVGEQVFVTPYEKDSDMRRIYLELPSGLKIKIADDSVLVSAGATKVVINRGGDVEIEAKGEVRVKSEGSTLLEAKGDMSLKADNISIESSKAMKVKSQSLNMNSAGDMSLNSKGKMALESTDTLNAKSYADVKIKGMNLEVKGDMEAKMEGGVSAKMEGGAMASVKGAIVNIN